MVDRTVKNGEGGERDRSERLTHPTQGGGRGGWGSTFQKSGKFHELPRKSIKKKLSPRGNFRGGVKKSKVREMS